MFVQPDELSEYHVEVHIFDQCHKTDVREFQGLMLALRRVVFASLLQLP